MLTATKDKDRSLQNENLVRTVLEVHEGDAIAALRSVIADAAFLHDELMTAAGLLGYGIGRGWTPSFQRKS